MTRGKVALALMAFNRPQYLEQVAKSIAAQNPKDMEDVDVHVFQDGAVSRRTSRRYSTDALVQQSLAVVKGVLPQAIVAASSENLGIAMNFDRAETQVFETLGYDRAIFFEDDMVLRPNYVGLVKVLMEMSATNPRIGPVAAYGYKRQASVEVQRQRRADLVPMGHSWGFGVLREKWRRARKVWAPYLGLIRKYDYAHRPHDQIKTMFRFLFRSSKFNPGATGQDAVKQCTYAHLGMAQLTTFTNNAKYIGEVGTHSGPAWFKRAGFASTVLYDEDWRLLNEPTPDELARHHAEICNHLRGNP